MFSPPQFQSQDDNNTDKQEKVEQGRIVLGEKYPYTSSTSVSTDTADHHQKMKSDHWIDMTKQVSLYCIF